MRPKKTPTHLANLGDVRLPSFLPEMVQDHLDQAGTAYVMRRDGLRSAGLSILDIGRQENQLRSHLSGLAQALDHKLKRRLLGLCREPSPNTPEHAFVAAFLLLRCGREHHECLVVDAWQHARKKEHRAALRDAMRLAGITGSAAQTQLSLAINDLPETREAKKVLRILACSTPTQQISEHHTPSRWRGELGLEAMRLGLTKITPEAILRCVDTADPHAGDALEAVLAQYCPRLLNRWTRERVQNGHGPSNWQLFTLAATLSDDHQDSAADWQVLMMSLASDKVAFRALWSLPYTGRLEAVKPMLTMLASQTGTGRALNQGFFLLTGIDLDAYDQSIDPTQDATFVAELKRHQLPSPATEISVDNASEAWEKRKRLCRLATPILLGRPRDLDALEQAFEHMTTKQWRGWLELLAIRSQGRIKIASDDFLERQWGALKNQRAAVDACLFKPQPWPEPPELANLLSNKSPMGADDSEAARG